MKVLQISINQPVKHLQSGQFSAELGWKHHQMTHREDTEVIIGLSGRVFLQVSGQKYTVETGDVLVIFPWETISGYLETIKPSEFIWFHFNASMIVLSDHNHHIVQEQTDRHIYLPRFFHLIAGEKAVISAKQLLDVAHSQYSVKSATDYATSMLLIELANNYWQQRQDISGKQNYINQIKEWIRVQMGRDLKVADIAKQFAINADYLTRIFKENTGMTVKEYMNIVKLDNAKYLLLTTSDSIQEIASQSFFEDPKYFMRLFKKKVQLTPRQYRLAYTHTFLNNQQVDPGVDIHFLVQSVENSRLPTNRDKNQH